MLLQMSLFHSFLWLILHCIYLYHTFMHLFVDGHLSSFHLLAIVNSAAMDAGCMYLFFFNIYLFISLQPVLFKAGMTW